MRAGRAQQDDTRVVELGIEVLGAVSLVGHERVGAGGRQIGEHLVQDLALVPARTGNGPGHRQLGRADSSSYHTPKHEEPATCQRLFHVILLHWF